MSLEAKCKLKSKNENYILKSRYISRFLFDRIISEII